MRPLPPVRPARSHCTRPGTTPTGSSPGSGPRAFGRSRQPAGHAGHRERRERGSHARHQPTHHIATCAVAQIRFQCEIDPALHRIQHPRDRTPPLRPDEPCLGARAPP
ncbi:hypothetical protein ACFFX0_05455 [Citricoccus parietis]|uniref:Uncharacterized protein n=1 Tax=Citricoccus parietis TaxID=592307 RepID=A0ABV5FVF2_9MICC